MQESIEHKLELRLRLKSSQISNIDRALAIRENLNEKKRFLLGIARIP